MCVCAWVAGWVIPFLFRDAAFILDGREKQSSHVGDSLQPSPSGGSISKVKSKLERKKKEMNERSNGKLSNFYACSSLGTLWFGGIWMQIQKRKITRQAV